ncbi:hypothetical protein ACFV6F_38195 [Kitasatospora phosalacinea]|uniref:hypothetical protein n=1 Tax=Kitasatospora phosalacinea TaxID=2065 RepID=UPI0036671507
MAWKLSIHLLDVGQGDSTLIVAQDDVPGGQVRSMLIDAGESVYGRIVHDYIVGTAGLNRLDHIVSTHYDRDHRAGLQSLLLADDLSNLVATLTTVAAANAAVGGSRRRRVAAIAAAVGSAAMGAYGAHSGFAAMVAGSAAQGAVGGDDVSAAEAGRDEAELLGGPAGSPSLIPNPATRKRVAKAAGVAAGAAIGSNYGPGALVALVRAAIFDTLKTGMRMKESRFWTANRYTTTHVVDLGPQDLPSGWTGAIDGAFTISNNGVTAPGVNRIRTSDPALGSELLWNSGPNAVLPPAGAPRAYVIGCNGRIWQGTGTPPLQASMSNSGNDCSIGLLISFNDFHYYTFGDMASAGEDPAMTAVMAHGLPDLVGGTLPLPGRMASFKCSHHGSGTSTSAAFLHQATPRTALISSGANDSYEHPDDLTVARLHHQPGLKRFYLTNCAFETAFVPASQGLNQLTAVGHRSRVAGDNNPLNTAVGRQRGNIRLKVTQAASQAVPGPLRTFSVRYWEDDSVPAGDLYTTIRF